jgi:hypothetical protein
MSVPLTAIYHRHRFKRWQELPEEVDSALVELVPDTMHQLTPSEKKQNWSKAAAEYQRVARTRFHVATAVKMHREYKKIRGAKQKSIWLAEQKKARTGIEAVCEMLPLPVPISDLTLPSPSSWRRSAVTACMAKCGGRMTGYGRGRSNAQPSMWRTIILDRICSELLKGFRQG